MKNPQELHVEFVRLGAMRHKLKNQMLAILPEIYQSGVWKKYAGSIEEYAGKYGDIAKTTVIKRLRLEKNLGDLPFLKAAIKTVGVHKVAMVAKLATSATDEVMAENVLNMSKMAVQSLSKELRVGQGLCRAVSVIKKIELDEESTFLFMKLKAKLGKNLSDKEFLKLMLEERERLEFPQKSVTGETFSATGRYVPVAKKRAVIAETNGKCAYPNCNSPYEILHHRDRYSESKSHDSIIPLCKIHHEFAHNNLILNETLKTDEWVMSVRRPLAKVSRADVLYRKYRREALV